MMLGDLARRIRHPVGALVVAFAIMGCTGPADRPSTSARTEPSPRPTATHGPRPTDAPSPTASLPQAAGAEAICAAIYAGRGSAPHAESGDVDDEMILFEMWHVALLDDAISQLGSAAGLADLVAAMDEMRTLSTRAALIYAEHPLFSEELDGILERQGALAEETVSIALDAGAPSCADVAVLP